MNKKIDQKIVGYKVLTRETELKEKSSIPDSNIIQMHDFVFDVEIQLLPQEAP